MSDLLKLPLQQNDDGTFGAAIKMTTGTRMVVEINPCGDIYDVVVCCEDRQYDHVPSWHYDGLVVELYNKEGYKIFSAPLQRGRASKYVADKPHQLHFPKVHLELQYPAQAAS